MFSNCTAPAIVISPSTSNAPVKFKSPVWLVVPTCVTVPVIFVLASVASPATVKFCESTTSLLGTTTSPVPLARNSKSELLAVVVMKLSSINISPVLN